MSTMLHAFVAIIIAIVNAQTYEDCGSKSLTVGGESVTMQLGRDATNSMVKITLTGPTDKWFGFVIGSGVMTGYGIAGQNVASTYSLVERDSLTQYNPGSTRSTPSGTTTAEITGSNGVITLERAYAVSGTYDFTDLMTCQVDSISIAAVIGSSLDFAKHTSTNPGQTFASTCVCTEPTTTAADSFELCAESELITDVALAVYRDTTNEKVRIQISGPNTKWFGYGFGTSLMIGSYAVTIEGVDSDNLAVVQRKLEAKDAVPNLGTVLTGGTISVTSSGSSTAVGVLQMAYDAQSSTFDFTEFLTCAVDSVPLIAAVGMDGATSMTYHGGTNRVKEMTLTRSSTCTCDSTPTTTASSANNIFNVFYGIIAGWIAFYLMV